MNSCKLLVTRFSRLLDILAGILIVGIMLLVTLNVISRTVIGESIMGSYEYVGFLTAVVIGFALSYCALCDGHIAVHFLTDRLPSKARLAIDKVVNTAAAVFWGFVAWHLLKYANGLAENNVVSSTTKIPFYPFIYLIVIGIAVLCLVLITKAVDSAVKADSADE